MSRAFRNPGPRDVASELEDEGWPAGMIAWRLHKEFGDTPEVREVVAEVAERHPATAPERHRMGPVAGHDTGDEGKIQANRPRGAAMRRSKWNPTPDTGLVPALKDLLDDSVALMIDAKQAHWNVKGPSFQGLHELFDKIHAAAVDYADLIGERLAQFGAKTTPDPDRSDLPRQGDLPEQSRDIQSGRIVAGDMAAELSHYSKNLRAAAQVAEDAHDAATLDILSEILRGSDKWLWFVESHLEVADTRFNVGESMSHAEYARAQGVTRCSAWTMGHRKCLTCGWEMFPPAAPIVESRQEFWDRARKMSSYGKGKRTNPNGDAFQPEVCVGCRVMILRGSRAWLSDRFGGWFCSKACERRTAATRTAVTPYEATRLPVQDELYCECGEPTMLTETGASFCPICEPRRMVSNPSALSFPCPRCKAPVGVRCRSSRGATQSICKARVELADKANKKRNSGSLDNEIKWARQQVASCRCDPRSPCLACVRAEKVLAESRVKRLNCGGDPAAIYCKERGGESLPRKDASGGEYALCRLPDGRVVEQWDLLRQERPRRFNRGPDEGLRTITVLPNPPRPRARLRLRGDGSTVAFCSACDTRLQWSPDGRRVFCPNCSVEVRSVDRAATRRNPTCPKCGASDAYLSPFTNRLDCKCSRTSCAECGKRDNLTESCPDCGKIYCANHQCIIHTRCAKCNVPMTARTGLPCGVCGDPFCWSCYGDPNEDACRRCKGD